VDPRSHRYNAGCGNFDIRGHNLLPSQKKVVISLKSRREVNRSSGVLVLMIFTLFLAFFSLLPPDAAAQDDADLAVSSNDVLFSTLEAREGQTVTIHALVRNEGEVLGTASVEFYDTTWLAPLTPRAIGSDQVVIPPGGLSVASVEWTAESGDREILVLVTDVLPKDGNPDNNEARAVFHVYGLNESLVFTSPTLLLEDANVTIEYSTERTVPIRVRCLGGDISNVTIVPIETSGLRMDVVPSVTNMSVGDIDTFFLSIEAPPQDDNMGPEVRIVLLKPEGDGALANIASLGILIHPSVAEVSWWSDSLATTAVAGGVLGAILAAIGTTELGRYKFICLLVPLYTKLRKEEILDQYVRGKIHGYILANPGDHYSSIRNALDLTNSSLAYHLGVLEKEDLVKSMRDGMYKRFYPMGARFPDDGGSPFSPIQKRMVQIIRETPGICQKDVASVLGVSSSTVSYHITRLVERDLITSKRRGMRTTYYIAPRDSTHPYG
jgi:DNA-binding MarR family transcriptional regulator